MKERNRASIILNAVFWAVISVVIAVLLFFSKESHTINDYIITFGVFGLINVAVFYINYVLLIPALVKKRKQYWWYIFLFIVLLAAASGLKTVAAVLNPEEALSYLRKGERVSLTLNNFVINAVFSTGFFLVASCIIRFTVDWFYNEKIQRDLESERKDMELQFLKSQLNPHFLFNSLNNIYSLAYQKSDKTADAILKLSEIMRYMIYESNDSWVSLDKELAYVQSYIELQKLRFKDGAAVEVSINGEVDGQQIVPLILISFVENAFKHGVANDPTDPIRINMIANQKILHFSVSNRKSNSQRDAIGGVGLSNVERRLELLYPDRYKLNVLNSATHYTTELMLDL